MPRDSENKVLKALVAAQTVEQGAGFSPRNEDKFMIADLVVGDWVRLGSRTRVRAAIDMQLMLIVLMICWREYYWQFLMSAVPTLLTSRPILVCASLEAIPSKNQGLVPFLKSATMYINYGTFLLAFFSYSFSLSITARILAQFLDTMHRFQPSPASTSQKPNPIPSVPPVTTAQWPSCWPYLCRLRPKGINSLTSSHTNLSTQSDTTTRPTMANRLMISINENQNQ